MESLEATLEQYDYHVKEWRMHKGRAFLYYSLMAELHACMRMPVL